MIRFSSLILVLTFTASLRAADPIVLNVDLTEAPRKLFKSTMTIPAKPGPLTLYYPKWIQSEHQPSGPINELSGLKISAAGKTLAWKRDDVDLYAFHFTVPDGVTSIDVSLDYLVPGDKGGYGSGPAATAKLAILSWYLVTLYPIEPGHHFRETMVKANLRLPEGWDAGTALPIESRKPGFIQYETASLETLFDSPAVCGQYFREIPIGPKTGTKHYLSLIGDSAASVAIDPKWVVDSGRLVEEAYAVFGARHYRSYRFLTTLSDIIGYNGIEHHESSDNRMPEKGLTDESFRKTGIGELWSHEFVHSWNGKFRRPASMCLPDYQAPMKTDLLWVYEGLTQYYGYVLGVRSGLTTPEVGRELLAKVGDWSRLQKGRAWRSLADTARAAPFLYNARAEWSSRRRSVDFYDEGLLIWLDADTLIREKTDGKKSLDDFCRAFHGGKDGQPRVVPYTFDDIVAGLNGVVAHDWKTFLERRIVAADAPPPLDGIGRGGWKVTFKDEPTDFLKAKDAENKSVSLQSSIGLALNADGKIVDVISGTSSDKAGLGPGMKILSVNGRRWDADRMRDAVKATYSGSEKLELMVENGEHVLTKTLDYAEGAKYPQLERVASEPDRLGEILKSRAK